MPLKIEREERTTQGFSEDLGNGISLEMVLIPSGEFLMGSPETELERRNSESPQHLVKVSTFLMGQYPVTQEQWRIVAGWKRIKKNLKPDPARFKGDRNPVERVSWEDATEFCARLSAKTGRFYSLPSEAEWEYACRAGTTTPFHFGETITTDLANYDASSIYGEGIQGEYRQKTTPVGSFPANEFGLYDMHGNVWEWCEDQWHDSYESAPTDGSAWIGKNAKSQSEKVLRGGSWFDISRLCRSAYRLSFSADFDYDSNGFRVICRLPRTL